MEVTGQLRAPNMMPCPMSQDLDRQQAEGRYSSGRGQPEVDWNGYDCCQAYDKNNVWCNEVVEVNHVNPERFQYNKFRYQMYAKPRQHLCHPELATKNSGQLNKEYINGGYVPAVTDVRALEQTMYIPVVPSNPGGQTEVTYPMTPQTMGQPDVTSACCVPVIPSQPGFKNMTSGIIPGPCHQLNRARGVARSSFGGPPAPGHCPYLGNRQADDSRYGPCAPNTMIPPSNTPGSGCLGLPDTFPGAAGPNGNVNNSTGCSYASNMSPISPFKAPHYSGSMPAQGYGQGQGQDYGSSGCSNNMGSSSCIDREESYDGMTGNKQCVNTKLVRYNDRVSRAIAATQETQDQKTARLSSMYGSFGSCLLARVYTKRHVQGPRSSLHSPGNGFQYDYPKHPNRLCYVLERNNRC